MKTATQKSDAKRAKSLASLLADHEQPAETVVLAAAMMKPELLAGKLQRITPARFTHEEFIIGMTGAKHAIEAEGFFPAREFISAYEMLAQRPLNRLRGSLTTLERVGRLLTEKDIENAVAALEAAAICA